MGRTLFNKDAELKGKVSPLLITSTSHQGLAPWVGIALFLTVHSSKNQNRASGYVVVEKHATDFSSKFSLLTWLQMLMHKKIR